MIGGYSLLIGDCVEQMRSLPAASINCCVTSPPYFGLRDYGVSGQIGLEATPAAFVSRLVDVFREVRRVLRDDGTLWLNLGDSYSNIGKWGGATSGKHAKALHGEQQSSCREKRDSDALAAAGLKPKDLIGIPWRVAFALQDDGWYLRQEIIWHKPNAMPESVKDRCVKAHEHIFLFSKSPRYYFNNEAIKEATDSGSRSRRSVWSVNTRAFRAAHFATFPAELIEPCILAGAPVGGVVLDPFGGSGTTAGVAIKHNRAGILCELNPEYAALTPDRIRSIAGDQRDMFMEAAE